MKNMKITNMPICKRNWSDIHNSTDAISGLVLSRDPIADNEQARRVLKDGLGA